MSLILSKSKCLLLNRIDELLENSSYCVHFRCNFWALPFSPLLSFNIPRRWCFSPSLFKGLTVNIYLFKLELIMWMLWNSPVGRWPSDRMTTPSSAIVIAPSSSLSNSMNASLNSEKEIQKLIIKHNSFNVIWVIQSREPVLK